MTLLESIKRFALEELSTLVRIPSISFPGFDSSAVHQSAEATAALLKKSGFQNVEVLRIQKSFPYVVGEVLVDPKLPTALLYAHHDVQPPGREELWKTPPFEPTEKNGRLYGRGTADDKAGILVHAAALKHYVNSSQIPPLNLKIIIEGEEEISSEHLLLFLNMYQERLRSDVIIVTDTGNVQTGVPSLTTSLRGIVVLEIDVKSLKAPLHSGMFGGGVVDPVQVLVKMLASLTDEKGNLILKSCQGGSKKNVGNVPLSFNEFAHMAGVLKKESVPQNFLHKMWYEPSFSINAIQASSEKLANNIICNRAYARMGIRVSEGLSAKAIQEELLQHLRQHAPSTVEVDFRPQEPCDAWSMDPFSLKNRWAFQAAELALEKAFGHKVVYIGCGASIPFIAPFEKALNAPVITLGVEDPYTLAHSENESLHLEDFFKAIHAEIELWKLLPECFHRGIKFKKQ